MGIDITKEYILNFGPHHPSTHGVLRLILKMSGEKILSCDPDIGYLHRSVEKLVEDKRWLSIIPYMDRLDYLAPLHAEHAYAMALESAMSITPPIRSLYIRTIFDELTRISSHIMAIGTATHDLGMLSLFLYGFEEREKIMEIFETATGSRMHLTYYIAGGLFSDINTAIIEKIKKFIDSLDFYMNAVTTMALDNRIFKRRTKGVGVISSDMAIECGLTGPIARASGIRSDLRKCDVQNGYGVYGDINFDIITLEDGDCYARTLLRFEEIKQSVSIISQCLANIPDGPIHNNKIIQAVNDKKILDNKLKESMYSHFFEHGIEIPKKTRVYRSVEGPRGEFGVFITTETETVKPYRLHVRSPSFAIIQCLKQLLINSCISDSTAILGSLDFIMGDCDR